MSTHNRNMILIRVSKKKMIFNLLTMRSNMRYRSSVPRGTRNPLWILSSSGWAISWAPYLVKYLQHDLRSNCDLTRRTVTLAGSIIRSVSSSRNRVRPSASSAARTNSKVDLSVSTLCSTPKQVTRTVTAAPPVPLSRRLGHRGRARI